MALIKVISALAVLASYTNAQSTLGSRAIHVASVAPSRPPLGLELPREEQGRPFYEADYTYQKNQPNGESGAPIYNEKLPTDQDYWTILAQTNPTADTPDSYDGYLPSLPAQDLTPPLSVLQWNPDNDPTLYFQLPVEITKETVPTNIHPKKYHKVLVEKSKPINIRPKEEISLIQISEDDLIRAEKQLQKTAFNQAKFEHQRKLQYERQQEQKQLQEEEEEVNTSASSKLKPDITNNGKDRNKSRGKKYRSHYSANSTPTIDNENAKLTIIHAYPTKDIPKDFSSSSPRATNNKNSANVHDAQVAATGVWGTQSQQSSLGSDEGSGSYTGDRIDFQMRGHAGPYSYKFGFDTGKGKGNARQFRYEERDNDGFVKGRYGYYDKNGKLHMIKYDASPHDGFHADNGNSDGDFY